MSFDYTGEVTAFDAEEILEKITNLHWRAVDAARVAPKEENGQNRFVCSQRTWKKAFYGFEPDFLHHNLVRIVDDAMDVIRASLELWPTLVESCYFQKTRHGLPMLQLQ